MLSFETICDHSSTYLEVVSELVDGNGVATRVVLQYARQEGLREVEAGDPEHVRLARVVPCLYERKAKHDQIWTMMAKQERSIYIFFFNIWEIQFEESEMTLVITWDPWFCENV